MMTWSKNWSHSIRPDHPSAVTPVQKLYAYLTFSIVSCVSWYCWTALNFASAVSSDSYMGDLKWLFGDILILGFCNTLPHNYKGVFLKGHYQKFHNNDKCLQIYLFQVSAHDSSPFIYSVVAFAVLVSDHHVF